MVQCVPRICVGGGINTYSRDCWLPNLPFSSSLLAELWSLGVAEKLHFLDPFGDRKGQRYTWKLQVILFTLILLFFLWLGKQT